MAIDWSLARQPDFVGNALQYHQAGQQARQDREKRNAFQLYAQDPEAGVKALMGVDLEAGLKARQALEADRAAQTRKTAAAQYASGDVQGAAGTAAAAGDLDLIKTFNDMTKEQRAETARRADIGVRVGLSLKGVPQEARPQRLQAMAPQLQAQGLTAEEIAAIPLDDAGIESGIGLSMKASEILDRDFKERDFGLRKTDTMADNSRADAQFQHSRSVDAARLGMDSARLGLESQRVGIARQQAGASAAGVDKATRTTEANLRKEFNALPDVKNYRTVATQAAAVKRLATAPPSANNDIAMVYAVMKSYDPTSVVRETEFATAQNAAGVPDTVRNQWNKVLNGQRLNPKQRAEMAQTVGQFADTYKQRFDTVANEYRGYADDYGASADRIVTVPQVEASKPPADLKARQGANGKFYAPDPNRPKSYPEVSLGSDGVWRMKSASGEILKFVP